MYTAALAAPVEARNSSVPADEDLENLQIRLEAVLGSYVREIRLLRRQDGLVLQGRARSFYAKQLAQTVLRRLCEAPVIANEIEVH
ncbi:hypothetical protein HRbin36_02253 [bacterium HR36]|nr:hypothetical protein HRbin36_02253 [bacterium HR36]